MKKIPFPLNGAVLGPCVPVRVTRGALVAYRYTYSLAASLHNPAVPQDYYSLLMQCPSGTILLTSYSMVWDWRVSRPGPMIFYWPKLLYPYYSLLLFSHSLLSVYRLVLWGWGLRTDGVYITVYQPCTADLF